MVAVTVPTPRPGALTPPPRPEAGSCTAPTAPGVVAYRKPPRRDAAHGPPGPPSVWRGLADSRVDGPICQMPSTVPGDASSSPDELANAMSELPPERSELTTKIPIDREIIRTLTCWLRPAFVLRVLNRFQLIAGFDRAMALASSALTALVPLAVLAAALLPHVQAGY
jgi:hypothetical protein